MRNLSDNEALSNLTEISSMQISWFPDNMLYMFMQYAVIQMYYIYIEREREKEKPLDLFYKACNATEVLLHQKV